jgi:hypothetical protein
MTMNVQRFVAGVQNGNMGAVVLEELQLRKFSNFFNVMDFRGSGWVKIGRASCRERV